MQKFKNYLIEQEEMLLEKLITFGNKRPRYGNIVILAGGAGCFDGETKVNTKQGLINIKDVKIGTEVLTFNEETKENEWNLVKDTIKYEVPNKPMVEVEYENGEKIICTEDHEFYNNGIWIQAKDLNKKIKYIKHNNSVYDLNIQNNHNYFIGNNKILVHNSGKGFVAEKLIGSSDYKVFDVDALKNMAKNSTIIKRNIKTGKYGEEYKGVDISKLDLSDKTGSNTNLLHMIMKSANIEGKQKEVFKQVLKTSNKETKPNIIFDVTLKDMGKFTELINYTKELGYDPKSINIVWVLNKLEIALEQNDKRDRFVPHNILMSTHSGAQHTMKEIMAMGSSLKTQGLDGDIWIAFNAKGVDSELVFKKGENGKKLSYVKEALLLKIKEKGKSPRDYKKLSVEIANKIIANNKKADPKQIQRYLDVADKIDQYPNLK